MITMKFIEDVTQTNLKDLVFVKTTTNDDNDRESQGVIDIVCESQEGEKYLVEMQKCYKRSFQNRLLYYGSKMYAGQLKMGDINYYGLKKVFVISIINFPFDDNYFSCHKILNIQTSKCLFDGLMFYVIDLSKFKKQIDELTTATDVWCFYLRNIHTLNEEEVKKFQETYPFIQPAVRELERFHFSPEEQENYMVYCMNNEKSNTMEELIADKVEDAKRDIAKKMLQNGCTKDFIRLVTGLEEKDYVE